MGTGAPGVSRAFGVEVRRARGKEGGWGRTGGGGLRVRGIGVVGALGTDGRGEEAGSVAEGCTTGPVEPRRVCVHETTVGAAGTHCNVGFDLGCQQDSTQHRAVCVLVRGQYEPANLFWCDCVQWGRCEAARAACTGWGPLGATGLEAAVGQQLCNCAGVHLGVDSCEFILEGPVQSLSKKVACFSRDCNNDLGQRTLGIRKVGTWQGLAFIMWSSA